MSASVSGEPIFSAFRDDEEFRELLEDFYVSAQTRRELLSQSFTTGQVPTIRVQAHQLKGVGGGYGFDRLSDLACSLEDACKQPEPNLDVIGPLLDDVVDYLSRIRI